MTDPGIPDKPSGSGTLYLVATPIGNMEDITIRALKVLEKVDFVAAEDTRRTRKILSSYDIHTRILSYNAHNKVYQGQKLLRMLLEGKNIAICSDAGMPLISDPGEDFVRLCIENQVAVTVIPGANAALSALVLSGFCARSFLFLGFPPRRKSKKKPFLESLSHLPHTLVFYESPFRVVEFLRDLKEYLGDRRVCVARELTKVYEETLRGNLSELLHQMEGREWKGEFSIVVEGACGVREPDYFDPAEVAREAGELIDGGMDKKKAFRLLADKYGTSRRAIYTLYLEAGEEPHQDNGNQ